MANNKKKRWIPLLSHCLMYTYCIWAIAGISGIPLFLVFASHVLIDGTNFIGVGMDYMGQTGFKTNLAPWSSIVIDQVWHLLILFAVTL